MLDAIREFVRNEVVRLEPEMIGEPDLDTLPTVRALRQKVRDNGWWAPAARVEWGGRGMPLREFAPISEALGWSPLGHYVFNAQAPDIGNIEILEEYGTPEQKERWLRPLVAGEIRSCFGMTEPENAGSNPAILSATARLEGNEWVIDAHKWFTTGADGAAFCIVMAETEPGEHKYGRASMIIVPTDTPGYELVRNIQVMGDVGRGWASHGEIRLTGARVPAANLLGARGAGFAIAQIRLGPGRIHHCMRWIGIAERALHMMCQRAALRDLGGGKPLGTRQTVQNWIAESRAEIDAARLMVLDCARQIDEGGIYSARTSISLIKFFVAKVMNDVVDRALQVHGGLGVTDDTVLAWYYRHERAARIYDGPDEVHKMVVARRILRDYGLSS